MRFARRAFARLSKYLSALAAGSMILSFIAITGMSPSMSRAGLVAGLSLLAWYYGRKFHPLVLLPLAAAVTVMINPVYAWGDLGWQLSFAAFAGVMILAPLMQRYYFGETKPGTLRQILGETMAAWLCTLPILVHSFGTASLVAVVANLLVLPLVPLAMLLVFISGLVGLVSLPLANFVHWPATVLLTYMTETTFRLASVPWAQIDVMISGPMAIGLYAVLIAAALYFWLRTKLNLRDTNIVE